MNDKSQPPGLNENDRSASGAMFPPPSVPAPQTRFASFENGRDYPANGTRITRQARYYAISELARRAGVPATFFRAWKISITDQGTVIEISNGTRKQILFPHASATSLKGLREWKFRTQRALWMDNSGPAACQIGELVIPFVGDDRARQPLFRLLDQDTIACTCDLPLSILLTLSRWEESFDTPRDEHGRFTAASSIAWREGFLGRPVVDECGVAFEEALQCLLPTWPKHERTLLVKVSHDIDHVGIPPSWRDVVRHTVRHGAPSNSLRDILGWFPGVESAELMAVREIVLLSDRHGLAPAVYWKASPYGPRDSGYDPRDPKVWQVIDWLRERNVEMGVHPGYSTFLCPEKLHREVETIRGILKIQPLGGRQHYLRWCPESWIHWENCGLAYDSSVGYAECVGFRAGTCIPYRPWLFPLNREAELLEIPLIVMDRTLLGYMRLAPAQCIEAVKTCVDRCRSVGGVFTLLWHNNALLDPVYRGVYLDVLETIAGARIYDWRANAAGSVHQ